ncbi:CorA family divalent cation transporter [Kocuria nitroreducens]|uniref:CorA family divalent cation transporter n=1 Tax=Kocuria nitroreducens TaxID=3058914 RepID=UPI0036D89E88
MPPGGPPCRHDRPRARRPGRSRAPGDDGRRSIVHHAVHQDATGTVASGEIHNVTEPGFVITVRQSEHGRVGRVRSRAESQPVLLGTGAEAVLYAVLDQTVDDHHPVVDGLEHDIDKSSDALFSGSGDGVVSRRICQLTREVSAFHRAVAPLEMELRRFLEELAARQNEAAIEQNEQMKRISSWAAILFAPSIVGSVYGMNFRFMPELSWAWSHPMALVLTLLTGVVLYTVFRLERWW